MRRLMGTALALILLGIAGLAWEATRSPVEGPHPVRILGGPFDVRYDAANDTTALHPSAACYGDCDLRTAYFIAGDRRDLASERLLHLKPPASEAGRTVPIDPLGEDSFAGGVTKAYAEPFDVVNLMPVMIGGAAAAVSIGLGIALLLVERGWAHAWTIAGAGVGAAWGWQVAKAGGNGVFLLAWGLLIVIAGLGLLASRSTRSHAPVAFLAYGTQLLAYLALEDYYLAASIL